MNARAQKLAQKFEQANQEVVATVEQMTDAEWKLPGADEGRTAGLTAHHIAVNYSALGGAVQSLTAGQAPPITWEMLHDANAEHMRSHATCTQEETLAILRTDGEQAANMVRNLSDNDLDRAGVIPFLGEQPVTTAQFIEAALIGHIHAHLPDIQAAVRRLEKAGSSSQ